jgi:hypothetical protein
MVYEDDDDPDFCKAYLNGNVLRPVGHEECDDVPARVSQREEEARDAVRILVDVAKCPHGTSVGEDNHRLQGRGRFD